MKDAMTKPNGWTGGPWVVGTDTFDNDGIPESLIVQRDGPLAIAFAIEISAKSSEPRKANARLIAAAPSLYEALAELIPWALYWINDNHPAMEKARAALQAAEGGV
jgi:hypothetical protein